MRGILFSFLLAFSLSYANEADVIAFSYDRPIQLHAFLETLGENVRGVKSVHVIYRVSDESFDEGYELLKGHFTNVQFHKQEMVSRPNDFKMLLERIFLGRLKAKYVLFAVDDNIVNDEIDVSIAAKAMEKKNAYAFFFRLGKNIRTSYMGNRRETIPRLRAAGQDIFLWQIQQKTSCWHYPNNVDMTLYRRSDVEPIVTRLEYRDPNTFEDIWSRQKIGKRKALCHGLSRVMNIPINVVNETFGTNRNLNSYSTQELLDKYFSGWLIDTQQYYKKKYQSPHVDVEVFFREGV